MAGAGGGLVCSSCLTQLGKCVFWQGLGVGILVFSPEAREEMATALSNEAECQWSPSSVAAVMSNRSLMAQKQDRAGLWQQQRTPPSKQHLDHPPPNPTAGEGEELSPASHYPAKISRYPFPSKEKKLQVKTAASQTFTLSCGNFFCFSLVPVCRFCLLEIYGRKFPVRKKTKGAILSSNSNKKG